MAAARFALRVDVAWWVKPSLRLAFTLAALRMERAGRWLAVRAITRGIKVALR